MSNRIAESPLEHEAPRRVPTPGTVPAGSNQRRGAALVAGGGILVLAPLAAFGVFVVAQGLVTDADAAKTARDIAASEGMFRVGVAALYAAAALDVLVAWALYNVFRPVHDGLSRLAAWFRLAYSAVFLVAISQLAGIPDLLNAEHAAAFTPQQIEVLALAKAETFTDIYMAALLLFGVHLLLLGWLTYASPQMPRLLGVLLAIAGVGYTFDTMAAVLTKGSPFVVSSSTFLGEFLLAVWLVVRGARLLEDSPAVDANPLGSRRRDDRVRITGSQV